MRWLLLLLRFAAAATVGAAVGGVGGLDDGRLLLLLLVVGLYDGFGLRRLAFVRSFDFWVEDRCRSAGAVRWCEIVGVVRMCESAVGECEGRLRTMLVGWYGQ